RSFERAKPNQLWQTDLFTFVLKRQNRRVYLVAIDGLGPADPLVLKSDNASAFLSADSAASLARWRLVSLLSPVRMPRYNGACEARIGAAKRRTEIIAAQHGRDDHWSADDLYAAQLWANEASYPGGFAAGTPASRFTQ